MQRLHAIEHIPGAEPGAESAIERIPGAESGAEAGNLAECDGGEYGGEDGDDGDAGGCVGLAAAPCRPLGGTLFYKTEGVFVFSSYI